ncbi:hypothetical protein Bbelb_380530 [Branchiostoma belcheri]|nr:hypothetical protein Bbelb_380530 [Branchiostoma belcheri]
MTRRVPQFHLEEIRLLVSAWLDKKKATRRELQSLIGKLVFVSSCVPPGRLFISRMLEALRSLRRNHHRLRLTRDFRLDLKWWQRFMDSYNGVSMMVPDIYSDPDELVMTDACATGCGGFSNGQFFHCKFPKLVLEQFGSKIHVLEMLTIVLAARKWAPGWCGQRILVHCDNMACVHVLNSGRARDRELLQCARELWLLAATFEFQVKATHIQGSHNRIADHLSRWHLSAYHSQQFKSLTRHQTTSSKDLTLLRDRVRQTKRAAFAEGTWGNLRTHLRTYMLFCTFYNLPPFPATVDTLETYAEFLSRSFRAPASIANYISGIKTFHILFGLDTAAFSSMDLALVLRGLKKQMGHTPRQKLPFTPEVLLKIHEQLDTSDSFRQPYGQ